RGKT
ncbi:hypothetical protein CP8484711_0169B, partial [Chlamydia psittaci 84-8471/1]